jgi:hypothetical protein
VSDLPHALGQTGKIGGAGGAGIQDVDRVTVLRAERSDEHSGIRRIGGEDIAVQRRKIGANPIAGVTGYSRFIFLDAKYFLVWNNFMKLERSRPRQQAS